jgi:uncharacterized phage protein (TIGR01671 family)
MRTIKFRAWHSEQKRMFAVYGLGSDFVTENTFDGVDPGINAFYGDDMNFIHIMQFTGRTDKNGKEIYDGDIIKEYDEVVKVFYNDCTASFDIEYSGGDCDRLVYKDGHSEHSFEVLGNIYENPELIKP